MTHQPHVTVLGSINVDTILAVEGLPGPGETVMARASTRLPGGKGANQAVAAARMGAAVAMVAAVGEDADGAWMRAVLETDGIDVANVRTVAAPTGAATIAIDRAGENLILVAPGANAVLASRHLPEAVPDVLLAQLEVPIPVVEAALARAGGLRLLNAAPAHSEAAALFAICDVIIVNEHELACYAGDGDAAAAARTLLSRPGQAVVVTLGAAGAIAVSDDGVQRIPGRRVAAVDTVGAGDCFCGALAAGLAAGAVLGEALLTANAAAALCTLQTGAIPAMPTRAAVAAELRASPVKNLLDRLID